MFKKPDSEDRTYVSHRHQASVRLVALSVQNLAGLVKSLILGPETPDLGLLGKLLVSHGDLLGLQTIPVALVSLDDLVQIPDHVLLRGLDVLSVGDLAILVPELIPEGLVLLLEVVGPKVDAFQLLPELVGVIDLLLESAIRGEIVLLFLVLRRVLDSVQDLGLLKPAKK